MSTQRKQKPQGISVRAAAKRLGRAPQTVEKMIYAGELVAFVVQTEAGHERTYVTVQSIQAWEQAAKAAAA